MLEAIATLLVVVVIIALAIAIVAYRHRHLQDALLYVPQVPPGSTHQCETPAEHGIERWERLNVITPDGVTLRGFVMRPSTTAEPLGTLVYFHGNAGNVGHRLPIARAFLRTLRCTVVMVDYRGYGLSDRVPPDEAGLRLDGQAVLDHVIAHVAMPRSTVVLMGTSLGGAVSAFLASEERNTGRVRALIVENSFTSVSDMTDVIFTPLVQRYYPRAHPYVMPLLKHVVKPLVLCIEWISIDRIARVQCPTLFLSGARDELVPAVQHRRLHDAARCTKEFVSFPNGAHNDMPSQSRYFETIAAFVHAVLQPDVPQLEKGAGAADWVPASNGGGGSSAYV